MQLSFYIASRPGLLQVFLMKVKVFG